MNGNLDGPPHAIRRLAGGSVLARSVVLNLVGQALPLAIGLVVTPFIIRRLGGDAFGVLSLGWTVLTLSLMFNLGLGRATTKFAAEHLARDESARLPSLFWTSIVLNMALGVVAILAVAAGSVAMIRFGVLKVPSRLAADAEAMFVVIAFALPFTFVTTTFRGMLEAGQHFAEASWARVVFTAAIFILPVVALLFSPRLAPIAWLLTLSRVAEAAAYAWLCFRKFPTLRSWSIATAHLRPLLVYSGWLTVTNLLLPFILNLDKFIIGSLLSVRAVAYYSVPADLVLRLTALPLSLSVPLFPAFSALGARNEAGRVDVLCARSMKYVTLTMAGVVGIVIAFAHPFLLHWLGAEFADNGARVMEVMSLGVLMNSIGYLPHTVLQAVGRPDLTAKCHLVETPIAVMLMWVLTARYGIAGTAVAWVARVALDWALLTACTLRLRYLSAGVLVATRCARAAGLAMLFVAAGWAATWIDGVALRAAVAVAAAGLWLAAVVLLALDDVEQRWLRLLPYRVGWLAA